jgi:2-amino-4-hydroxy-6-hydroxymethyldihydropteridine diphosphokinase
VAIAYLSLGSNIGDRTANLRAAMAAIDALGKVLKVSSFYETEPVEFTAQDWFVNCVLELDTNLEPRELMDAMLGIEQQMGRRRDGNKGPRIIDLDLLLFEKEIIDEHGLKVPHPAMHERRFVLAPLAEIAPEAFHPVLERSARELLEGLGTAGGVVKKMSEA